jgi:uncharacterized protein YkwD
MKLLKILVSLSILTMLGSTIPTIRSEAQEDSVFELPIGQTTSRKIPIFDTVLIEESIYAQINQYRQSKNLRPLALDLATIESARKHSQNMADRSDINIGGFGDSLKEIRKSTSIDNAARHVSYYLGNGRPDLSVFQKWIENSEERQTILDDYNITGIGVAQNSKGECYFTQIFARTKAEVQTKKGSDGMGVVEAFELPTTPKTPIKKPEPEIVLNPIQYRRSTIATSTFIMSEIEGSVHDEVNRYRQSQNLPPLAFDPIVAAQARAHSEKMLNTNQFNHNGFDARRDAIYEIVPWVGVSENIAYNKGYRTPGTTAVKDWIESPGHKRNMLGGYDRAGVGVAKNSSGEYYFTQIFIRAK